MGQQAGNRLPGVCPLLVGLPTPLGGQEAGKRLGVEFDLGGEMVTAVGPLGAWVLAAVGWVVAAAVGHFVAAGDLEG